MAFPLERATPASLDLDPKALDRLIAKFDLDVTVPNWALGYRFDIVLRGHSATPFEAPHRHG